MEFFATAAEAENAGYRACKRCQPQLATYTPECDKIGLVCQFLLQLRDRQPVPSLDDMAKHAGLSKHHFHRSFKRLVGVTPKAYLSAIRRDVDAPADPSVSLMDPVASGMETRTAVSEICEHSTTPSPGPRFEGNLSSKGTGTATTLSADSYNPGISIAGTLSCDEGSRLPFRRTSTQPQPVAVHYMTAETTFGHLSVAFINSDIYMLDLSTTLNESLDELSICFKEPFYALTPVNTAGASVYPCSEILFTKFTAVVEALERPSGRFIDLAYSY